MFHFLIRKLWQLWWKNDRAHSCPMYGQWWQQKFVAMGSGILNPVLCKEVDTRRRQSSQGPRGLEVSRCQLAVFAQCTSHGAPKVNPPKKRAYCRLPTGPALEIFIYKQSYWPWVQIAFLPVLSLTCPQEGKGDDFRLGLFTERRQSGTVRAGDQCALRSHHHPGAMLHEDRHCSFSHNHGSGEWVPTRLVSFTIIWPCSTSMIMRGRVAWKESVDTRWLWADVTYGTCTVAGHNWRTDINWQMLACSIKLLPSSSHYQD